jgi:hypothetical protein
MPSLPNLVFRQHYAAEGRWAVEEEEEEEEEECWREIHVRS